MYFRLLQSLLFGNAKYILVTRCIVKLVLLCSCVKRLVFMNSFFIYRLHQHRLFSVRQKKSYDYMQGNVTDTDVEDK
jgi:hypothetical protein